MSVNHGHSFRSPGQFFRELCWSISHPLLILGILRGKKLDAQFRERVMLAVTEVNRCTICAWAHTRVALSEGLSKSEVQTLLQGALDNVPPEQHTAILFAQHWADTRGEVDADARVHFEAAYDQDTLRALDATMRFIRFNNYCGVFAERILGWLSLGRLRGNWGRG